MSTRGLEVVRTLREGIARGLYAPGSRLNENELAVSLNVSRTPVRGALSTLAAEGLLIYTPNSGYTVRDFSSKDIEEIYAVRATLEGMVARLAATNGLSDTQRGTLHRLMQETERLIERDQWDDAVCAEWQRINLDFHQVIYDASDNAYLVECIKRTDDIPFFALIRFQWFNIGLLRASHLEHVELADALFNRQPSRADALETEHVYRSGRRLVSNWRRIEERMRSGTTFEKAVRSRAA